MYKLSRVLLRIVLLFVVQQIYTAPLMFDSQSSKFKVDRGATLSITNPVPGYDGTLVRQSGGTITGAFITFTDGVYEDAGNELLLDAIFNPAGIMYLPGNSRIRAEPGNVLQSIQVSSMNNLLQGQPYLTSPIVLQDSNTTLTLQIQGTINQDIALNGGTLILQDDARFTDGFSFTGSGTIFGNGYQLGTGSQQFVFTSSLLFEPNSNLVLWACRTDLRSTFTFLGVTSINGNGNVLDLEGIGQITIGDNSTLSLQDVTVKGVGPNSFIFTNTSSTIQMCNVTVEMISNITTNQGNIFVEGPTTFIVKNFNWTFAAPSTLTVDGVTLWKDPLGLSPAGTIIAMPTFIENGAIQQACVTPCATTDFTSIIEALITSTGFLQSQIDICCSSLMTSTGFLQSEIDTCCNSLKTSTGFLQSEIDACCRTLTSRVDVLQTCCDALRTSTGFLQSEIDSCCTALKTSTGFLQSEIDACCTSLRTSTGFLQSEIDTCCRTLTSRVDILQTCCDQLRTSTGFLQSEIDACCTALKTSTGFLQSEIDFCCNMVTMLKTSTGFLQSQIDMIVSELVCCGASFVTQVSQTNDVQSTDWSSDEKFVALGMNNNPGGDINTLKIFSFNGSTLTQTDQFAFGAPNNLSLLYEKVTSVRWHPTSSFIATTRNAVAGGDAGLRIFAVSAGGALSNPPAPFSAEVGNNVVGVAWSPGTPGGIQRLAVLTTVLGTNEVAIYNIAATGQILNGGAPVVTLALNGAASQGMGEPQAIDWNINNFIVVGESQNLLLNNALEVFTFTPPASLVSNVSVQVPIVPGMPMTAATVSAVGWDKGDPSIIAVGLSSAGVTLGGATPQTLQIWKHASGGGGSGAGSLTFKSGVPDSTVVGTITVNSVNFNNIGTCLAVGKLPTSGGTFQTYSYNDSSFALSKVSEFGGPTSGQVFDVRYSPKGDFIVDGSMGIPLGTGPLATVYKTVCINGGGGSNTCCDILQSMIDMLKTSTGFLQSQIDTCCSQLKTSTGFLQSEIDACCTSLKTSTGFLQSEIDTCCRTLTSRVDILQTCCDQLRTSTGFLQSEIDACCNSLKTSTGFLQSEIDVINNMSVMLKTSTGFLQSEIDACCKSLTSRTDILQSCCDALRTSTGFLQSEIDFCCTQAESCCDALKTSTGFLQSQIDTCCKTLTSRVDVLQTCCDQLRTSTGFLQSEIDACCKSLTSRTDILQSCCDALRTSTGFLQSEIDFCCTQAESCCDALKTSTGFLQSQIDTCCRTLTSRVDVLQTCCDQLRTSTGFLQSEIDFCCTRAESCCDALKTSTGFLQSQIDTCCLAAESCCDALKTSTGFLQSQIDVLASLIDPLETCCEQLRTSTGFLQSQLDACCNSLTSRVDVLETCCDQLRTSTGFLQSEIDTCCSQLQTSTGFLQSEIDACCNALKTSTGFLQSQIDMLGSRIDILETCCDQLRTSTGFLQSQIDALTCEIPCCNVAQCDQVTLLNDVETGDWSFDSRFIAIGLDNRTGSGDIQDAFVVKIYENVNCKLVFRTSFAFTGDIGEVTVVRWNPNKYRLAVGRRFESTGPDANHLHIFDYDPLLNTLTLRSESELNTDVFALAWRPSPVLLGAQDILAVGRNVATAELALYEVDSITGALTGPLSPQGTDGQVSERAIDWNVNGQFIAVGVTLSNDNKSLQVYEFDPIAITIALNASSDVDTTPGNPATKTTALAVDWSLVCPTLIAVGLQGTTGELAQVIEHNGGAGTLTHRTGIAGLQGSVLSVDWKDCSCLALGLEGSALYDEVMVYAFDQKTFNFSLVSEFNDSGDLDVEEVRWSPNGKFLISGSDTNLLTLYRNECRKLTLCDLLSRVEILETCCDELRTSTGELQSQLDNVCSLTCISINISILSRVEILETCCAELRTSTGFLQSELDTCCHSLESRVDILETCCDELRTSTGFLQSQIDNLACVPECCNVAQCDQLTLLNDVETEDWSFDDRFVAVGIDNRNGPGDTPDAFVVKIYENVNCHLVFRTSFAFTGDIGEVTVVRWHPSKHRLAVGRRFESSNVPDANHLHIFDYDPLLNTLTLRSESELNTDVFALAWRPQPILLGAQDVLAVGRDVSTSELVLYQVNSITGALTGPLSLIDTDGQVSERAIDWNINGQFVAVGVAVSSDNKALQVYEFDPIGVSLSLNASSDVDTTPGNPATKTTALAVDWSFVCPTLIAVGLQGSSGELAQVIEHDGVAGTLTHRSGISGLLGSVLSVSWKDCLCLALGLEGSAGYDEFMVYTFDKKTFNFTLASEFNDSGDMDVEEVRWSHNGKNIVTGSDSNLLTLYRADCRTLTLCDLLSRIELLETCCDTLRTSTGELQSQLDSCCSELKTSTGFLQSQIDACCTSLDSRVDILETCCDQLRTSTGFLQSQIDNVCSLSCIADIVTVISRVEVLESCCDALRTSTGFLQSEIDRCCIGLESRVEILETCCDQLRTSTGFLQSQIDTILCPLNCCELLFVTKEPFCNDVETGDWSFDSKFIAIGLGNNVDLNGKDLLDAQVLKVYEFDGTNLILRAETSIGNQVGEVTDVAWHPDRYRLAVSRKDIDDSDEPRLHIFDFDPVANTLTETDNAELNDVYAVAWRQLPVDDGGETFDILAVGRDVTNGEVCLYEVGTTGGNDGKLFGPFSPQATCGSVSTQALDWNVNGQFLAVGVQALNCNIGALQVYEFDPIAITLTFNASNDLETTPGDPTTKTTVLSVDWNLGCPTLLAAGGKGTTGQLAQVFDHNGGAFSLIYRCGIDGLDKSVLTLDWRDCFCLALGKSGSASAGAELRTYKFDPTFCTFLVDSQFDDFDDEDVEIVHWSPNGCLLLAGSDDNTLRVYKNNCRKVTFCDLISRVEVLETCCDALRTSTGFLQSQIDECCKGSLESRVEVLETCCEQLKTSTGFLQSQIDECCDNSLESRIEVLETCCEQLKTSTGFLQSQIDLLTCPIACCDVLFKTNVTELNDVETGDWSFDNRFIAIGLGTNIGGGDVIDPKVLKVYELVGTTLILRAETTIGVEVGEVTEVRWHPTKHRLAVGRKNLDNDEPRLHIFDFNPVTFSLVQTDASEPHDVFALAWRTEPIDEVDCGGLPVIFDVLAVGRDVSTGELALYTVSQTGLLGGPNPAGGIDTDGQISNKAIDWNFSSQFIAVGVQLSNDNQALQIYEFDECGLTFALVAATNVPTTPGNPLTNATVTAVDWASTQQCCSILAVGLEGDSGQLAQVFDFDCSTGSLTYRCGINDIGATVYALDWRDCTCLGVGTGGGAGAEFRIYEFNEPVCSFLLTSSFDDFNDENVEEVRWSPNGKCILNGTNDNTLNVYQSRCRNINFCELVSIVEVLETCCDQLRTSTGFLQSEIDHCCNQITTETCIIEVRGDLFFNLSLLPTFGNAVVFHFNPCFGCMCGPNPQTPKVIFDPAVFGNGGVVPIAPCTRIIFTGEGFVRVHDGVKFEFEGTPFTDGSDWPALIIEEGAIMDFTANSTVVFGGDAGKFIVRQGAELRLDKPTHVLFGDSLFTTEIIHHMIGGKVSLSDPNALISYNMGTFDIIYDSHSTLDILKGTVELNTLNGAQKEAIIRTLKFTDGSTLRIGKTGDPSIDGLLRFAPNFLNFPMDFDNRAGIIFTNDMVNGGGNIQFRSFDGSGNILVNTTLIIQTNYFAFVRPILEAFMELSYIVPRGLIETPDATILAREGTIPDPAKDGTLVAYCPSRDGSIVELQQGDHDVRYDSSTPGGPLDTIRGYNFLNQIFTIFNCDASTRVDG